MKKKKDALASKFEKFKVTEIPPENQNGIVGGITGGSYGTNEGCTSGDEGCCDSDTCIYWDSDPVYRTTSRGISILVKESEITSETVYM